MDGQRARGLGRLPLWRHFWFPPSNRSPAAVLKRVGEGEHGPSLIAGAAYHSPAALHAGSLAALAILRAQPFQSSGDLVRQADAIVSFACGDVSALARINPPAKLAEDSETASLDFATDGSKAFRPITDDVAHAALIAARAAIQAVRRLERAADPLADAA